MLPRRPLVIGCPALREEAFSADKLEAQFEEQAVRIMSDRERIRSMQAPAAYLDCDWKLNDTK